MFGITTPADFRTVAIKALIALVAFTSLMGGAYLKGRSDGRAVVNAQALRAMKKGLDAIEAQRVRISAATARAAEAERNRQIIVREFHSEVPTIIRDPVYRNICVDDAGVRALDRLTASANGLAPSGPAGEPGDLRGRAANGGPGNGEINDVR